MRLRRTPTLLAAALSVATCVGRGADRGGDAAVVDAPSDDVALDDVAVDTDAPESEVADAFEDVDVVEEVWTGPLEVVAGPRVPCDCEATTWLPDIGGRLDVGGEFERDRAIEGRISENAGNLWVEFNAAISALPVYASPADEWPDLVVNYAGAWIYEQTADGVWTGGREIVGEPGITRMCLASADLHGDAAWELVCTHPFGFYEGYLAEDGSPGLAIDDSHWHPLVADDGTGADPIATIPPGQISAVRVRDLDRDGDAEFLIAVREEFSEDYLLERRGDGSYRATAFRTGTTLSTCEWDLDRDGFHDAVYAFKDGGFNEAGNLNGLYRVTTGGSGIVLDPHHPVSPEVDDDGWFGHSVWEFDRTPMGCAYIDWLGAYFLSQSDEESPLMRPLGDGTVCNLRPCVPGFAPEGEFYLPPEHWGVVATSFRGARHEMVAVSASINSHLPKSGTVEYWAVEPGRGQAVFNGWDRRYRMGSLDVGGDYYGLVHFDLSRGDGRPDLIASAAVAESDDVREPIRVFVNQLELVDGEDIVCLELLGSGGESARVRFEFSDGAVVDRLVADGGNRGGALPPVIFQGGVGEATVEIARPGATPESYTLGPGACWRVAPGVEPYRLRAR